jgi:RND family efflux transporter MFP subunit
MTRTSLLLFSFCFLLLSLDTLQAQEDGVPVEVSLVTREAVARRVTLTGTVFPKTRSVVASEVEGLVDEIFVEEGDFVKKGVKIAELGASIYRLQLTEAQAAQKETEQRYFQAKADLKRSEELVAKGFVAEKQLTDDRFNAGALQKKLNQHEAEIARLEDLLGKTEISAPFSGEVARKHTEVGQWLDKGGAVVTLIDLSRIRITVSVPERYISRVRVGQPASVTADAFEGKTYQAKVYAIISEGDPQARVFPVKFEVDNRAFELKSGMLVRVTFETGRSRKALMVPKDALVSRGEGSVVFAVRDGVAREVAVSVQAFFGSMAEVSGKIEPEDQVVVRGNERLRDGQPVQVLSIREET